MRARSRGRLVFTKRGHGAEIKPETLSPPVPLLTTPTEIILNPPAAAMSESVCPHGGVMLGDIFVCGICGGEDQIGLGLMHIARMISWKIPVATATWEDVMMTAVLAMIPNQKKILSARNPSGLAYRIGQRAVFKMYRPKSVLAFPVGKMKLYDENGGKLETSTQKLEFLDQQRVRDEEQEQWAADCYERSRTFPALNLVWTERNFQRLQEAIDDARKELPTTPVSWWMVLDMRLGYSQGMGEHGWQEIASTLSPPWKPISERAVRRIHQAALDQMRISLVNKLLPCRIPKELGTYTVTGE
jgi:hypothetical protein